MNLNNPWVKFFFKDRKHEYLVNTENIIGLEKTNNYQYDNYCQWEEQSLEITYSIGHKSDIVKLNIEGKIRDLIYDYLLPFVKEIQKVELIELEEKETYQRRRI